MSSAAARSRQFELRLNAIPSGEARIHRRSVASNHLSETLEPNDHLLLGCPE